MQQTIKHYIIFINVKVYCVVPENIHTSPTEGIFFQDLPTPLEIPIKLDTFLSLFGLREAPTPQEIPIPSVGGVWIFSGAAHLSSPLH